MPRRRKVAPPTPPPPQQVHIQEADVFTKETLQARLGLARNSLSREIRLGRLRVAKRAGRYFFLGKWVLDWIAAGELKRQKTPVLPAPLVGAVEGQPREFRG